MSHRPRGLIDAIVGLSRRQEIRPGPNHRFEVELNVAGNDTVEYELVKLIIGKIATGPDEFGNALP
ncbi:hypothetical protein [Rhizobium azibense]|uniref:hypothetical protein n=1 Tax=Rhizobium azibense TaxID=1136135 RepID=UPI001049464C|nr:hypothetical protein [Rhizobium azibense]